MFKWFNNDLKLVKLELVPDDCQHTHFFTLETTLDENVFLSNYKDLHYYFKIIFLYHVFLNLFRSL